MSDLLQSLRDRLAAQREQANPRGGRHSRFYVCRCGNPLFFDNTQCLSCKSALGYLPDDGSLDAIDPQPEPGTWRTDGREELLKSCANRDSAVACNWMVKASTPSKFCISCHLTRTIPDLADPVNLGYLRTIEHAKRRLVSQLLALGLPVRSKVFDDPKDGLMFDFLRSPPNGPRVMTGHSYGLITLNVEEADDAKREQVKQDLHEPYRTLLGHFRHEVGHYYWNRLIMETKWLAPFRELFGDERASYSESLKRNYEMGPPANWADSHISAYATTHPWEDWAETWAHFMHIVDSLGTAMGYGVNIRRDEKRVQPFVKEALFAPEDEGAEHFLDLLNAWVRLTVVLNEFARSMGEPDFYPFIVSKPVVAKLQFIQMIVADARTNVEL
ncbi:MAG: putative zinc-binding metallopeptidase [Ramlibacter sp.]